MLAFTPDESHPLVDAFFADQLPGEVPPEKSIHRRDYMWRFALDQRSGQRDLALLDYFRGGLSVARLVQRVLRWRFGPAPRPRLLDFAAGFGRATRYLIHDHDPRRVWASDILPAAVSFLQLALGDRALPSATRPEDFVCPQRFDAIVAASFFSHLPGATFVPWLRRLYRLLSPSGVLILSVHGRDAWRGALDSAGHAFLRVSEIDELPTAEYGISQVSEAFMTRGIGEASDGQASYRRLPRGLWSYQDVYLITPDGAAAATEPLPAGEPMGYLYEAEHPSGDTRYLRAHGWSADFNGGEVERVEMAVNGTTVGVATPGAALPEIAADFGQPELPVAAWEIVAESPGGRFDPRDVVLLKAVADSGESYVLHADTLRGLLATESINQLRHQTDRAESLERQLQQMRQSRFWKLRDAWWDLRGRLRVG